MKEIVLDIETANTFQDVGKYDPKKLDISVIGIYFYDTDEYRCFEESEFRELWPRLEQADRLIGYNLVHFDLPVMNRYYAGDLLRIPTLDIMLEIQKHTGFRLKLDDVAAGSLGTRKSGKGLQAVEWWRRGEKEKVKQYCLDDVRLTRQVYEYGLKYGTLAYEDFSGKRLPVPVDFRPKIAEKAAINLTMGF